MIVKLDFGRFRTTTWREYATRFVSGGVVTLLAGLIADKFGPGVGGLFPAIFPASASLIEKHQKEKKRRAGVKGDNRGRLAADLDAAGGAMGCLGLIGFAATAWKLLPSFALWESLALATGRWTGVAVTTWLVYRRLH